jgi:hypothetical protein
MLFQTQAPSRWLNLVKCMYHPSNFMEQTKQNESSNTPPRCCQRFVANCMEQHALEIYIMIMFTSVKNTTAKMKAITCTISCIQ